MMLRSLIASASRRVLRVQYASDLHLEFLGDKPVFPMLLKPVAPVLVLAGDIGQPQQRSYRDLLYHCSRNWDDVFVVAGNHELYGGVADKRIAACRSVASEFNNVHFLERDRVVKHGVTFLGCTLWTHNAPQDMMNDYRKIRVDDGKAALRVGDTNSWHARDKEWLRLALANTTGPTVVVTHHLPSFRVNAPEFADHPANSGFASDCDELIASPVSVWIAGHTHRTVRMRLTENGPLICVNPLGYPNEKGVRYNREAVIEVPLDPTDEVTSAEAAYLDEMSAAHATGSLRNEEPSFDEAVVGDDVVFI